MTQKGTEPITIIEVQWTPGGNRIAYADRNIGSIQGRILEVSQLDAVVTVSGGSDSQKISVTLDDTQGDLKSIFDNHDIHKRPVWVYQWFDGLDLSDRFLLFTGQINSPVVWNEADRTLSFDVVTKVEDKEVGFSAEEGRFSQIPDSLIGKAWPLAFGTVLDIPAIRLDKTVTGTTQEGVGIISGKGAAESAPLTNPADDVAFNRSIAMMNIQASALGLAAQRWFLQGVDQGEGRTLQDQANAIRANITNMIASKRQSEDEARRNRASQMGMYNSPDYIGPSTIHVLGGEDFPQGIPVEVEIGNGGYFTGIFNCQEFRILSRRHPGNEQAAASAVSLPQTVHYPNEDYDIAIDTPRGQVRFRGFLLGTSVTTYPQAAQIARHYWADAGSTVRLVSDLDLNYLVSIVPGTVKAVKAYKRFEGARKLINVPNEYWTQQNLNYGDITVATVRLTRQLSGIPDQGWEDDLYVTFESSVGPNTVDIMRYLIETYSDLDVDEDSFAEVRNYLDPFPSNFAIFERKQIIQLLDEIAFQARCAVFVKNDTVYLKYLPAEPPSVQTITVSDVAQKSLSITMTETEEIVTKMIVNWRPTYADENTRKMVFRHNVDKYGVQEREFEWYIYNQPDIIRKAATFWLIRMANTWKRVRFDGYLNLLNVETFDAVTLNLSPTIGPVKAMVESAIYDSSSNTISFECLTPIKSGTTTPYQFFWPYDVPGGFPTVVDNAGSRLNVSGDLPVGSLVLDSKCPDAGGIIIGGPNIVFQGPADLGDPTPSDIGFQAQPIIAPGTDFSISTRPRPNVDLQMIYAPRFPRPIVQPLTTPISIDIAKTTVVDSDRPQTKTTFSDILKYDPESDSYAARRAYLAED